MTIKQAISIDAKAHAVAKLAAMPGLIHYSHGEAGQITPSIAELYDRDPNAAKLILDKMIAEGRRRPGYLDARKNIEDYMRSKLPEMGVNPGSKYPTYAILDVGRHPELFSEEGFVNLPMEKLKDKVTFTVGDSFPALLHHVSPKANKPIPAMSADLMTVAGVMAEHGDGRLLSRLGEIYNVHKASNRKHPADYVEAQIWEDPKVLTKLFTLPEGSNL